MAFDKNGSSFLYFIETIIKGIRNKVGAVLDIIVNSRLPVGPIPRIKISFNTHIALRKQQTTITENCIQKNRLCLSSRNSFEDMSSK